MIKVLVVDDQHLMREGLATILQLETNIEVVGTAGNGREAYEMVKNCLPDVVLMDIRMPIVDGVEGTRLIKEEFWNTQVLILTTFNDMDYMTKALEHGASGYLLKETPSEMIVSAIATVQAGGVVLQPTITAQLMSELKKNERANSDELSQAALRTLTERELEVLKLVSEGCSNKEIAEHLYISEGTVKIHISNMMSKMQFRDRTQAAIFAVKTKLSI
ncbi:response regulator [Paenibacillus paeoniae]|uniref:DNA-binding response regulator n=1 Tax=Paenibacillus paeoniae TaxID=2292705 RepID=A0A371PH94_9BACL|nr:response regulator transcription factor [Paenibacillus paeoniae]REK74996.1 DNA-binding response regulator [Paenibacillus paeoniae]